MNIDITKELESWHYVIEEIENGIRVNVKYHKSTYASIDIQLGVGYRRDGSTLVKPKKVGEVIQIPLDNSAGFCTIINKE